MGGFAIFDAESKDIVESGRYYGAGLMNNEEESFALCYALYLLSKLISHYPSLKFPMRVFLDSQLMKC